MDVLTACQAFVSVTDRGSFTRGAAAVGASQPVVSRRVAALEEHLGGTLLDRSGRAPVLTLLGRRLLPAARRVVEVAETLVLEAEEARLTSVGLAVPSGCDVRDLAAVELAGLDGEVPVITHEAGPHARPELLARGQVVAAVLACAPDAATWRVPLGVAGALPQDGRVHLDRLRPRRGDRSPHGARIWLLPEDDVPHVRDPLVAGVEAAGMSTHQVAVAASAAGALSAVLASSDLLVLSAREAERLDLSWAELAAPRLARGYVVAAVVSEEAVRLTGALGESLAGALGVPAGVGAR